MPLNYSVIPVGLLVDKQIPILWNSYPPAELILADLGTNNNLAFTYHKGQIFYCGTEKSRWEWREFIEEDNISEPLMPANFTYPTDWNVNDVDYSSKSYNFFKIKNITEENIDDFIPNAIPGPQGNGIVSSSYNPSTGIVRITFDDTTFQETGDLRGINGNNGNNGREVELQANASDVQWRLVGDPTWIDLFPLTSLTPIMAIISSETTTVNGDGTASEPYQVEVINLQATKTDSFALDSSLDQHTIFIENGIEDIVILVPTGIAHNFSAIFYQKGTGEVLFAQSGTTIEFIPGLGLKMLTQNATCCIEKDGTTNNFQLYGQLKA